MSAKTLSWILFVAITLAAVFLFNYWASYQPLSTLVYAGAVAALLGIANLAFPFRFLGVRQRYVGALVLAGGTLLFFAALSWPAATSRVSQPRTCLDDVLPEYQFYERHTVRVHAQPARVLEAVRQSTFGDMTSLSALLKVRAAALRIHDAADSLREQRVLDAFVASGFLTGGNEREVVCFGIGNPQARPVLHTVQDFVTYHGQGAVKMAFNFAVEDSGDGWSTLTAETRVLALDKATSRGMGRYWRLIVPGSGLLRRQWLDNIRKRAETETQKG